MNDAVLLNPGTPEPLAAIAVVAAGSGHGEGGLFWEGVRYRAIPSEGGHTDFAPQTELEIHFLRFMMQEHSHVSYERLVSRQGLHEIYRFFRSRASYSEPLRLGEQLYALMMQ